MSAYTHAVPRLLSRLTCAVLFGVLSSLLSGLTTAAHAADGAGFPAGSAHARVQQATDELLAVLASHRDQWSGDRAAVLAAVDTAMAPYVDYPTIARGVMARYWGEASAEQRKAFTATFRDSLVRGYTGALMQFDIQRIDVQPDDGRVSRPDRALVRMSVHTADGQTYPIEYAMARNADGGWLVRNVVVNGANLGLTWRNQFAGSMRGSDLDSVISGWGAEQAAAAIDAGA